VDLNLVLYSMEEITPTPIPTSASFSTRIDCTLASKNLVISQCTLCTKNDPDLLMDSMDKASQPQRLNPNHSQLHKSHPLQFLLDESL